MLSCVSKTWDPAVSTIYGITRGLADIIASSNRALRAVDNAAVGQCIAFRIDKVRTTGVSYSRNIEPATERAIRATRMAAAALNILWACV